MDGWLVGNVLTMLNNQSHDAMTKQYLKLQSIFGERVRSLLEDNYKMRFSHHSDSLWYVRMVHMANGNHIDLKCYPDERRIVQLTNHVETFNYTYGG